MEDDKIPPQTATVQPNRTVSLGPRETKVLREALRKSIRECEKQAIRSIGMVVFSIVVCIATLLLGDKVDDLFMSDIERRALDRIEEAKFKIMEKVASLDDKAIEDIDVVYSRLRSEFGLSLLSPQQSTSPLQPDQGLAKGSADVAEPSPPPIDLDSPAPDEYIDVKEVTLPIQDYDTMRNSIVALKSERSSLLEKIKNLEGLTDNGLREQNVFYKQRIEELEKNITAMTKRVESSDSKAEANAKARENLTQKIGELNEKLSKAAVMEELKSMLSTGFIRGGSLILLVWLVRIFVRKYQHAVNGREFYSAALNALQISGVRSLADFKEAFLLLRPGEFELRDADLELLGDKITGRLFSVLKTKAGM